MLVISDDVIVILFGAVDMKSIIFEQSWFDLRYVIVILLSVMNLCFRSK